jgi:hypothetical protein
MLSVNAFGVRSEVDRTAAHEEVEEIARVEADHARETFR